MGNKPLNVERGGQEGPGGLEGLEGLGGLKPHCPPLKHWLISHISLLLMVEIVISY